MKLGTLQRNLDVWDEGLNACIYAQLRPTLCDPMDCSPPGSSVRGIPRQECWSGLLFAPPGDLLTQGWNPSRLHLPHWQADSLPQSCQGSPKVQIGMPFIRGSPGGSCQGSPKVQIGMPFIRGSPGGASGQSWLPKQETEETWVRDMNSIPGWGRSLGEGQGNPLQYSCLEQPMDRGACWATVHRVAQSRTRLKRQHPRH